ncbi:hypothetical protein PMAYCL1PPCAC_20893, partial [Pristionchus mayeri]
SGSVLCDERSTLCIRTKNKDFEIASCASSTHTECNNIIVPKCPPPPKGEKSHVCCCKEDGCNKGAA